MGEGLRERVNLEEKKKRRYEGRLFRVNNLYFVIADSAADPQSQDISKINQPSPQPSSIGEGAKPTYSPYKKSAFTLAEGATHVAHFDNTRRAAFTLAEVLITLGIIGIVAAMTIPSLISKYQFKVWETAFKKQYSTIQNALEWEMIQNSLYQCYFSLPTGSNAYVPVTEDCDALITNLISSMHLTKIESNLNEKYAKMSEVIAGGGKTVNSTFGYDYILRGPDIYNTKDGAVIMFVPLGESYTWMRPQLIIDVNGEKGPNKWGYDVFFMMLTNHNERLNRILLTDEMATMVEKGGRLPRNILRNKEITEDDDFTRFWDSSGMR